MSNHHAKPHSLVVLATVAAAALALAGCSGGPRGSALTAAAADYLAPGGCDAVVARAARRNPATPNAFIVANAVKRQTALQVDALIPAGLVTRTSPPSSFYFGRTTLPVSYQLTAAGVAALAPASARGGPLAFCAGTASIVSIRPTGKVIRYKLADAVRVTANVAYTVEAKPWANTAAVAAAYPGSTSGPHLVSLHFERASGGPWHVVPGN